MALYGDSMDDARRRGNDAITPAQRRSIVSGGGATPARPEAYSGPQIDRGAMAREAELRAKKKVSDNIDSIGASIGDAASSLKPSPESMQRQARTNSMTPAQKTTFTPSPPVESRLPIPRSFSSPESTVATPPLSPGTLALRPDRALNTETYGDQARIVGGNSPQAASALQNRAERAAGAMLTPNLSERDLQLKDNMGQIDKLLASGMQPTEHQAGAIAQLRRDAGFLRGGTDRYVAGPDGRPVRGGGGGNYSFQGSPEMASRFTNAVAPGEYIPEAVAVRGQQQEQFLSRNGYEKVDPNSGLTQSELRRIPVIERAKVADAIAARANDRIKAEADRTQAQGVVEVGKGNLAVNQATQETAAKTSGLDQTAKQMGIDEQRRIQGLQKQYDEAKTPEERAIAERSLVAAGALKRDKPEVFFDQEFDQMGNTTRKTPYILENGNVRSAVPGGGTQRPEAPPAAIERLKKFKDYENFKAKYGYIPEGV
jgi:hypothetical protein